MYKQMIQAFNGYRLWNKKRKEFDINAQCTVIVLPEADEVWNKCAVRYLGTFMKRKHASRAVIFTSEESRGAVPELKAEYVLTTVSSKEIKNLMQYFLLYRFFDNIVFLYKDFPRDNMALKVLQKSDVSVEELICYGFYKLREVPEDV